MFQRDVRVQRPIVDISSSESGPSSLPILPAQSKPYIILHDRAPGLPVCLERRSAVLPKSLMDHLRNDINCPWTSGRSSNHWYPPSIDASDLPSRPDGWAPLKGYVYKKHSNANIAILFVVILPMCASISTKNVIFEQQEFMIRDKRSLGLVDGELFIGGLRIL